MISLNILKSDYVELKKHLYPGDGLEAGAFALCGRAASGDGRERFLVHKVYLLPYEVCERRADLLTWSTTAIVDLLDEADQRGLCIVKFHSHPGGYDRFSSQDTRADAELFPSICSWAPKACGHCSVILLENDSIVGRRFGAEGDVAPFDRLVVIGDDAVLFSEKRSKHEGEIARRQVQVFGPGTHSLFRGMKIGVVGTSGTGSIVLESIKRHLVGQVVLVDPKIVTERNLNRMVNTTMADAEAGRFKVQVMADSIRSAGLGTTFTCHASDLEDQSVVEDLATCDFIFGCMDSADGRHLLNLISTYFLIPYIDMGVSIAADGDGGIDSASVSSNFIVPGKSTLLSRGVFSSDDLYAASLLRGDHEEYKRTLGLGYIKGVDVERPAVQGINNLCVALAFEDFLARLHGYRIDGNRLCAQRTFSLRHNEFFCLEETSFKSFLPWVSKVALGDLFFEKESSRLRAKVKSEVEVSS